MTRTAASRSAPKRHGAQGEYSRVTARAMPGPFPGFPDKAVADAVALLPRDEREPCLLMDDPTHIAQLGRRQ